MRFALTAMLTLLSCAHEHTEFVTQDELQFALKERSTARPSSPKRAPTEQSRVGLQINELKAAPWITHAVQLKDAPVTLVVFWELWCPHCKNVLPRLPRLQEQHPSLQVVALTQLTRKVPVEAVKVFIEQNDLDALSVGVTTPTLAKKVGPGSVPSAIAIVDGKVIWAGHPIRVTSELIQQWTATAQ